MERTPCHNPQSESESDLCAQWRAAKAAEKSADWTLYGVIASAIGISFLLWQIMLTREAVRDTGNATAAMLRQNELAEEAMHRQLRAYMATSKVDLLHLAAGSHIQVDIRFINSGATPAYHLGIGTYLCLVENGNSLFVDEEGQFGNATVGPSQTHRAVAASLSPATDKEVRRVKAGELRIFVVYRVRYMDAFQQERRLYGTFANTMIREDGSMIFGEADDPLAQAT